MSWYDKQIKRAMAESQMKEIMNTRAYKEARKKDQEEAALTAYCSFCLVACDFLQLRHGYKKKGIMKFLKYASEIMVYIKDEDDNYFNDMNQVMIDECGIDVLGTLGVQFKKEKDNAGDL